MPTTDLEIDDRAGPGAEEHAGEDEERGTRRVMLRMPDELYRKLVAHARGQDRSINMQTLRMIRAALAAGEGAAPN